MINNVKDGSGQRLKEIRKKLNLSQKELANCLNMSNGHICDLENDRKNITITIIKLLTLLLDVNEKWLKTGVGNMFIEKNTNTTIIDMVSEIIKKDDDNFKKKYLTSLSQLNDEEWETLEKIHNIMKKTL